MQHLKGFGLENFRVFKDYTWFDFAPITLLIGPNSSGKSSLIKALLLAKDNFDKGNFPPQKKPIYEGTEFSEFILDNPQANTIGFENVISSGSNKKGLSMSCTYDIPELKEPLILSIELLNDERVSENFQQEIIRAKHGLKLSTKNNKLLYLDMGYSIYFDYELFFSLLLTNDEIEEEYYKEDNLSLKKGDFEYPHPAYKEGLKEKNDKISPIDIMGSDYISSNKKRQSKFFKFEKSVKELNNYRKKHFDFKRVIYSHIEVDNTNSSIHFTQSLIDRLEDVPHNQLYDLQFEKNDHIELFFLLLSNNGIIDAQIIAKLIFDVLGINDTDYLLRFFKLFLYVPSVKSIPQRSFDYRKNEYLNELIKHPSLFKELGVSYAYPNNEYTQKTISFIEHWSKEFKLNSILDWKVNRNLGVNSINIDGRTLADLGFGISQLAAILLSISIGNSMIDNPIYESYRAASLLIVEEPETNLHPAFQSKLANLFTDSMKTGIQFIIETHSEYMVRKFQYLVAKGEMKKEDIVIYYFNDPNNIPAGEPQVKKIEILEDGSLSDDFGGGFFDEAANWELELLRLKKNKIRQN